MAADEPTVTLSQIATLAGVRPSAVSNWRKRFDDFPQPIATAPGGRDLYPLADVEAWLLSHDRFDPGRKSEKLLLEAAHLLRGQTGADTGIAVLAAAIALLEFCERLDIQTNDGMERFIGELDREAPQFAGVFEPLLRLEPASGAQHLLALAGAIDESRRADVFEWVLAQRTRFVETRTSDELTELLVALVGDDVESVLDPAAGEAGVLAAVKAASTKPYGPELYGQEVNDSAWRIAVQRLFLHVANADIRQGNSLTNDQFSGLEVDVVVCDPPYGMPNPLAASDISPARWANFRIARARSADFAWLEYAIEHLSPDGRAYVVLGEGTLFHQGLARELRADLLRRGAVEAVVALPPGTAERTMIPLALWMLRRPQPSSERPVLVIDANRLEDDRIVRLEPQVARIHKTLSRWRASGELEASDASYAALVPIVDVLAADADLSPDRWIQQDFISVDEARSAATAAYSALAQATDRVNRLLDALEQPQEQVSAEWVAVADLAASEIAQIVRGARIRPEDCGPEGVRVLRTRDIRDEIGDDDPCFLVPELMRPRPALTQPGDVIVSPASGRLRALVDEAGGHALAAPLQALRINDNWIDPHLAAAFLEDRRNRRFVKSAHAGYARIDLREFELPILPPEQAARLRDALNRLAATEREGRELARLAADARDALLRLTGP